MVAKHPPSCWWWVICSTNIVAFPSCYNSTHLRIGITVLCEAIIVTTTIPNRVILISFPLCWLLCLSSSIYTLILISCFLGMQLIGLGRIWHQAAPYGALDDLGGRRHYLQASINESILQMNQAALYNLEEDRNIRDGKERKNWQDVNCHWKVIQSANQWCGGSWRIVDSHTEGSWNLY